MGLNSLHNESNKDALEHFLLIIVFKQRREFDKIIIETSLEFIKKQDGL